MTPSSKLVFFGTEDFSLPTLRALVDSGYNVAAVVTKPDTPRGRSKQLIEPAVKVFAREHNLPVLQPQRLADIQNELETIAPDAGVLVSYGKILPGRTLDVFGEPGIINIHPSLLPRYRGPAPIEAAILAGDTATGISIMRLTAGMDEGPIFAQTHHELDGTETKPELNDTLSERGASFLLEVLDDILTGKLSPTPQQTSGVSYTTLISKQDGMLTPATDDAHALERKVRAYLGYPKSRLSIKNTDVIITSVKVVESLDSGPLVIECADNTYLEVRELIAPSGKTMSGEAFLRGYSN